MGTCWRSVARGWVVRSERAPIRVLVHSADGCTGRYSPGTRRIRRGVQRRVYRLTPRTRSRATSSRRALSTIRVRVLRCRCLLRRGPRRGSDGNAGVRRGSATTTNISGNVATTDAETGIAIFDELTIARRTSRHSPTISSKQSSFGSDHHARSRSCRDAAALRTFRRLGRRLCVPLHRQPQEQHPVIQGNGWAPDADRRLA